MTAADTSGPETDRKKCTLLLTTIRYLDALSKRGTHGRGIPGVMTTLIEEGVRQAIEKGYIKLFEDAGDGS
jgi:hypothetical protein